MIILYYSSSSRVQQQKGKKKNKDDNELLLGRRQDEDYCIVPYINTRDIKVVYNFVVFFCFCFLVVRNRYLGSVLIPVLSKEPILLIPQLCLAVLLLNKQENAVDLQLLGYSREQQKNDRGINTYYKLYNKKQRDGKDGRASLINLSVLVVLLVNQLKLYGKMKKEIVPVFYSVNFILMK